MRKCIILIVLLCGVAKNSAAGWWNANKTSPKANKVLFKTAMWRLAGEQEKARKLLAKHLRELVVQRDWGTVRELTRQWIEQDSENPSPYEFLFLSLSERDEKQQAVRAITSLVDLAPTSSSLLCRTGECLMALGETKKAEKYLRRAVKERSDNHNNSRALAASLALQEKYEAAVKVLEESLKLRLSSRYVNLRQVLREEMNSYLWLWKVNSTKDATEIEQVAARNKITISRPAFLRFSMQWDTETSDVDLIIRTPRGEECSTAKRSTRSGLMFYADIAQGLGPEVVVNSRLVQGRYHLGVKYFSPGAMAISRGTIWIFKVKDNGQLEMNIAPFVVHPSKKRQVVHVKTINVD